MLVENKNNQELLKVDDLYGAIYYDKSLLDVFIKSALELINLDNDDLEIINYHFKSFDYKTKPMHNIFLEVKDLKNKLSFKKVQDFEKALTNMFLQNLSVNLVVFLKVK